MPLQGGMKVPLPSRMLEASWLLLRLVCQSREVKSGMGGMAGLTRVPRPSSPWQAKQRVVKMPDAIRSFSARAAVLMLATGSAVGTAGTLLIVGAVEAGPAIG